MSHIAVDLKVIEVLAPMVARAASISEDRALAGLVRLWHRCWSTTSDTVTLSQLAGVFGGERIAEVAEVLCADFLEHTPDGYRVKGADMYLRITEAKVTAGKARASGAPRVGGKFTSRPPADHQQTTSTPPAATSEPPALTPSTEHRAPSTEKADDHHQPKIAAFEIVRPDLETIDSWPKEDFWRAAEVTRRSMGFPPEKWPHPVALSRWWTESRGIAEVRELAEAFTRFTRDKHWATETPPAPFGAFMKFYNNFLPTKRS